MLLQSMDIERGEIENVVYLLSIYSNKVIFIMKSHARLRLSQDPRLCTNKRLNRNNLLENTSSSIPS